MKTFATQAQQYFLPAADSEIRLRFPALGSFRPLLIGPRRSPAKGPHWPHRWELTAALGSAQTSIGRLASSSQRSVRSVYKRDSRDAKEQLDGRGGDYIYGDRG